ncbi:hypothetical protein JCM10450v2_003310 [Rhodotorula kratochvilovae]
MGVLPRTRQPSHRTPSLSSVGAFASSPSHVWRRPHRVALVLFATLVLLTLSALEIGGPAALSEPHSSLDELNAQREGDVMNGGNATAEPQAAQLAAVELPAAVAEPAELFAHEADLAAADEAGRAGVEAVPAAEGLHGFGSEVSLLLRVATVASHFGYAVFLDSTSWNYGAWDDYFLPLDTPFPPFSPSDTPPRPCRIPPPTVKRFKMALSPDELAAAAAPEPFTPNWSKRNHLVWHTRDMDGLDATFLRLFADAEELAASHRDDLDGLARGGAKPAFLTPEETLPAVHAQGFAQLSRLAASAWRPNALVRDMADGLERRLALPVRRVEGAKKAGDLLIGVHVRLGDKFLETDRIGPVAFAPDAAAVASPSSAVPGLHRDLLTSYFAAAIDSVHSLLSLPSIMRHLPPSSSSAPERIRSLLSLTAHWASRDAREKPTLALMSDDDNAVEAFRAHPLAKRFRIVGTAEVPGPPLELVEDDGSQVEAEEGAEVELPEDVDDEPIPGEKRLRRRRRSGHHSKPQRVLVRKPTRLHAAPPGKEGKATRAGGKRQGGESEIPAGFNELEFNALPLSSRISSARLFVRDLTVLARRSDALVVTGSSNVGRLMMLLFEASKEDGRGGRRELRSLDTSFDAQWIKTADCGSSHCAYSAAYVPPRQPR